MLVASACAGVVPPCPLARVETLSARQQRRTFLWPRFAALPLPSAVCHCCSVWWQQGDMRKACSIVCEGSDLIAGGVAEEG